VDIRLGVPLMANSLDDLRVDDDGLVCGEVGRWAETKYRLISLYDKLFATGMKNKWEQRVYIDLYAGSGHSRIRDTEIRIKGSPIFALSLPFPFDKYVFCEESDDLLNALKARVTKIAEGANVAYVPGKCDNEIDKILREIPRPSRENRVLSLCLVDPFDFGIKFETIRKLSAGFVDFLVLLAVGMDAGRNYDHYVDGNHPKIDDALGNRDWRERWKVYPGGRKKFREFLAAEFALSMRSLGYLDVKTHQMKLVRSNEKNLPLYYLALFSRNQTAYQFWDEVLKYGTDQQSFTWG
jgi:three-Cys-motif partner protein